MQTGTKGAELLTSWSSRSGTWTTLTTTGNVINSAICTVASELKTNNITVIPGELYLFYSSDFANVGSRPYCYGSVDCPDAELIYTNKGIIIMPTVAETIQIVIGIVATEQFSGTFHLYKITTDRTAIGNPLAPYFINFTEVYEDSTGITQTGATQKSKLQRYIPAKGDAALAFIYYILNSNTSQFANFTLRNLITKFFTFIAYEYWSCFFTEYVELRLYYGRDAEAITAHSSDIVCAEGWGVVIMNVSQLFSTVANKLSFRLIELGGSNIISADTSEYIDTSEIDERVILEFDGDLRR